MHLLPLEVRSHQALPSGIADNMANAAFLAGAILYVSCVPSALAAETAEFTTRLEGDLGLGVLSAQGIVASKSNTTSPIPYANVTYGRWFARIDTVGLKTAKIGWGYLEVIGRVNSDALKVDTPRLAGLNDRKMSAPIGVGSLQVTPVGAFFINAFHDFGASRGHLRIAVGRLGRVVVSAGRCAALVFRLRALPLRSQYCRGFAKRHFCLQPWRGDKQFHRSACRGAFGRQMVAES